MTDDRRLLVDQLNFHYGKVHAVVDLTLEVPEGSFLTLLGPSGCGKSTTLSVIAGLEHPSSGRIWLGERDITAEPPNLRGMALVFQNYALYPHQTVYDNIAFGLRLQGLRKREVDERVRSAVDMLDLGALLNRKPGELSGGQQQRVALGRALVKAPSVFLFDEPFSNLDATLRARMRTEVKELHMSLGTTSVLVTHDQEEAMTMSNLIAVMRDGRLVQSGTPREIYDHPLNTYVASFVGKPTISMIEGEIQQRSGVVCFRSDGLEIPLGAERELDLKVPAESRVLLGIRAEDLTIDPAPSEGAFKATVHLLEPVGSDTFVHLAVEDHVLVARVAPALVLDVGQHVHVRRVGRFHLFDARTGERINR